MGRELIAVEVRPVTAPDGRPAVLLQLPDGFVLLNHEDARDLAVRLVQATEED